MTQTDEQIVRRAMEQWATADINMQLHQIIREAITAARLDERRRIMFLDEPWSLISVLGSLVQAADILLNEQNYDGHGHELIKQCRDTAMRMLTTGPMASYSDQSGD